MTRPAEKLWGRLLLVALCAVLAAGGAFFASCFAYGRSWRTGASRDFDDSEFAAAYVADCMGYLMDCYTYQNDLPTEAAARGYGRGSFGCVLLCDGEPLFDTTTDKAACLQTESFYRYDEIIAEGSLEDYTAALWYGPFEDPRYGTVVYAAPAVAESSGTASGEASGETDLVLLGVEHEYTLEGYLNYPIEPYGGLYAESSFWQLMLALENWALPLAILCWALAAALAFTLARDALRRKAAGADILTRLPFDASAAAVVVLTVLLSLAIRHLGELILFDASPQSGLLNNQLLRMMYGMIRAFMWTAAGVILLRSALARDWRDLGTNLLVSRLSAEARVLFPLWLGAVFLALGFGARAESVILVGFALVLLSGLFSALLFRQLRRLRKASEKLAAGELGSPIAEDRFWPGVREQAAALNRIGDGIKTAVDEQLKGERLKTELITNVSHDLKTPVTSIVSCADLLKKPDLTPEQTAEYVEMLGRQSRKLQKLTDDLVEASKASSGAIDVRREPTDVRELLNQSVGEFAERLEQRGITPVLTLPEEPCVMLTDGQLLWRVLDNLLRNVCNYAQPDTRAYFDLETSTTETVISLKNVSSVPLNISAETLMERFVRGDASRSTEGSGLGLSIAQSLTRLLGGELTLHIDGDLFKAVIRFDGEGAS